MSTVFLNTSSSDNLISSTTKSLQTIDVDDVKKQYEASTSKSIQVQVNADDGKEVEVEQEKEQQQPETLSTTEPSSGDAELASFEYTNESEEAADAESELFNKEMELALEHVRKLALFQKESLVNSICDTFASFNGREASINDISAIFGRIKNELAEEAQEDAEDSDSEYEDDSAEEEETDSDSEYHPNDDAFDYDLDQDVNELDGSSEADADDADYDPTDAEDVKQVEMDLEEDGFDESEQQDAEEEEETVNYDEEAIINSEEFDAAYFEAMQCVVNAAKLEKEKIYAKISKKYQEEFGDEVIEQAFEQFVDFAFENEEEEQAEEEEAGKKEQVEEDAVEYEDESEDEPDVTSTEYRKQMDAALDSVRSLAASHKEAFVDEICGAFSELNGEEPSVSELSSLFSAIKAEFAEEARKEFLSDIEESADEEEEAEDEDVEEEEEEQEVVNVD